MSTAVTPDVQSAPAPPDTSNMQPSAQTVSAVNDAVQAPPADPQYQQAPQATAPTIDNSVTPKPLWQSILGGALVGLAHGGVLGGLLGATNPRSVEQAQQDAAQKRQLVNQNLEQELSEGNVRMAHTAAETAVLNTQYSMMPKSLTEAADQQSFQMGQDLEQKQGVQPTITGITHEAATEFLQHAYNTTPAGQQYVAYSDGKGAFNVYKIQDPNATNRTNMSVTTGYHPGRNADGSLDWDHPVAETQDVPAGTMKISDVLHSPVVAGAAYWKDYNSNAQKATQNTADINKAVTINRLEMPGKIAVAEAEGRGKQRIENEQQPVYAYNPRTQQTEATSMEEARTWGPTSQTVPRKVTETQMNEDRMLNNRLSDVENKTDQYDSTFQAELSPKDYTLIAGLAQKAKIDWHGLNVDTSALYQPAFLSELSPEGQARLIAYRNAREAMTGYQRVLSGSGRSSDKSMELNLETLPAPNDPASFARHS